MLLSYVNSLSFVGWWAFAWACTRDERARETTGTRAWEIQRSGVSKPSDEHTKPYLPVFATVSKARKLALNFILRLAYERIENRSIIGKRELGFEFFKILKIESKVSWDVERKIIYRVWFILWIGFHVRGWSNLTIFLLFIFSSIIYFSADPLLRWTNSITWNFRILFLHFFVFEMVLELWKILTRINGSFQFAFKKMFSVS